MNHSLLHTVLRHAGGLTADPAAEPDADLLGRFARDRDEPAFAELLRRHGPMVWAVCRHMLPDPADAEDAFQATFLALVRSAAAVRRGAAVGGWLHGVAVRVATRARRAAARRKLREHRVAGPEADRSVPEATWETLLAAVHEEVQQLPAPLRAAFVLCDLEGVRQPDAAARLGWKPGTLTGRLARARRLLMDRLAGRGLAPAVAGGTVGLGMATATAAVPASLADKAVSLIAAGGVVPPAVLKLVRGVTPMALNRTKLAAAAILVAGGLTAGIGAALIPIARAQPAAPPGAAGGGAPPSALSSGLSGLGGAMPPPASAPAAGSARGSGAGSVGAGGMAGTIAGPARVQWEYLYADAPRTQKEFAALLTARGREGWEFGGVVEFPAEKTVVFKRPKGGGIGGAGGNVFPGPGGGGGIGGGGQGGFPPPAGGGRGGAGFPGAPGGSGFQGGRAEFGLPGMPGQPGAQLLTFSLKKKTPSEVSDVVTKTFPQGVRVVDVDDPAKTITLSVEPPAVAPVRALIDSLEGNRPQPAPGAPPPAQNFNGMMPPGLAPSPNPKPVDRPLAVIALKRADAMEMSEVLKKVFTGRVEVVADERTNSLIIRADSAAAREAEDLIKRLDVDVPNGAPTRP